jgi:hypothetical protein
MPDSITAVLDNPVMDPVREDGVSLPPADLDNGGDTYVLNFRDREAAEKGFKELQAAKTRAEQKAAQLEKDQKQDEINQKLVTLNEKLVRQVEKGDISEAELETQLKAKAEALGVDPDLLNYMGNVMTDHERRLLERVAQRESELLKKFEQMEGELKRQSINSDTFYQTNRSMVDGLAEKTGKSVEDVIAILRAIPPTATGDGNSPPPGIAGGAGVVRAGETRRTGMSAEEEALYRRKHPDATPEELKATTFDELKRAVQKRSMR